MSRVKTNHVLGTGSIGTVIVSYSRPLLTPIGTRPHGKTTWNRQTEGPYNPVVSFLLLLVNPGSETPYNPYTFSLWEDPSCGGPRWETENLNDPPNLRVSSFFG